MRLSWLQPMKMEHTQIVLIGARRFFMFIHRKRSSGDKTRPKDFLPVGFSYFVYKQNPDHFVVMWQNSTGRLFVMIAIGLQIAGMIIIKKVSTIRI